MNKEKTFECRNCNKNYTGYESDANDCLDFCCSSCEAEFKQCEADMREEEEMEHRHERELRDRDLNDNSIYL